MIYYIIPTIIIIVSLAVLLFLVIKKFPKLATINIESIPQERESKVKNRIMLDRLYRKFVSLKKIIASIFRPITEAIISGFSGFYQTIINLERKADQNNRPLKSVEVKQEINDILLEAEKLYSQNELNKAEENYIKVINLDPKNFAAYEGLVAVYKANRDYKKARETSKYCIKLLNKDASATDEKHRLASCYADLGEIYQLEDKIKLALTNSNKAIELEPSNPRFLDFLLKISIMLKNKELALKTFKALKEADPENQKLEEIKEEINNLPT